MSTDKRTVCWKLIFIRFPINMSSVLVTDRKKREKKNLVFAGRLLDLDRMNFLESIERMVQVLIHKI